MSRCESYGAFSNHCLLVKKPSYRLSHQILSKRRLQIGFPELRGVEDPITRGQNFSSMCHCSRDLQEMKGEQPAASGSPFLPGHKLYLDLLFVWSFKQGTPTENLGRWREGGRFESHCHRQIKITLLRKCEEHSPSMLLDLLFFVLSLTESFK